MIAQGLEQALRLSLVVPMRNEVCTLEQLIRSIRAQTRQPDEIVLVDGGSSDGTAALAKRLTAGDKKFSVVEAGPATPGRGRNIGISMARFDWIALTDAGICLEPTWLERLAAVAESDSTVEVVYGNYEPISESWFEHCAALAYLPPKIPTPAGRVRGPCIPSTLLRKEVWRRIDGFLDLRASEDLIFMERVKNGGFKVGWAPTATVWWRLQPNLYRTFKRFAVYSYHTVRVGRQREWQYGVARQHAFAAVFVLMGVVYSYWWALVPVFALIARVAKSIWQRREGRGGRHLLLPFEFLTVGVILLTLDAATFTGWAYACWCHAVGQSSPWAASREVDS